MSRVGVKIAYGEKAKDLELDFNSKGRKEDFGLYLSHQYKCLILDGIDVEDPEFEGVELQMSEKSAKNFINDLGKDFIAVSYTHLTLPTKRIV